MRLPFSVFATVLLLSIASTASHAQEDIGMEMPDGLSSITYLSNKVVVQEISSMPDFLDFKVDYVAARAFGDEGKYGGLRFTRSGNSDLIPYSGGEGSGSIARGQLAAAAAALQQISDQLLNSKPSKRTVYNYQTDDGVALVGEWDGSKWNSYFRLTNFDMGLGTPLQTKDVKNLADMCMRASKM